MISSMGYIKQYLGVLMQKQIFQKVGWLIQPWWLSPLEENDEMKKH